MNCYLFLRTPRAVTCGHGKRTEIFETLLIGHFKLSDELCWGAHYIIIYRDVIREENNFGINRDVG